MSEQETCGALMEPARPNGVACERPAGHDGSHGNPRQGVTWPPQIRCRVPNPERSKTDMKCLRAAGHGGYHRDSARVGDGVTQWNANTVRKQCGDRSPDGTVVCDGWADHTGSHMHIDSGRRWNAVAAPDPETVPAPVLSRIRLHRAQAEHDLAVAEAQLYGQPALSMAAKRLRLRITLLRSEARAWADIELYAGGGPR